MKETLLRAGTMNLRRLRLPFRCIEPTFFSGLLDDPVLLLNIRPLGRSVLVDCGQIHHLAKRVLKSVDVLFITHAHMDHFMGMDTFVRNVHVSPRTIELFGPPGIAGRLAHKLAGYVWNLTEDYWCSFRVREISDSAVSTFFLPGPEGFPCRKEGECPRTGRMIYRNDFMTAEAELGDHKTPVLIFRFTENPSFQVDERKIEEAGLARGPWLRELKKLFFRGRLEEEKLRVLRRRGDSGEESLEDAGTVYRLIRKVQKPASIGYVTDIGLTEENLAKVLDLLRGVTLLICECSYLKEEREKARLSYHLCTSDINFLLRELRPACFLPMHLSKTYIHRCHELYEQLEIPPEVTLVHLPEHVTPRPLLPQEVP
jgi:ribonuclease Z